MSMVTLLRSFPINR